MMKENPVIETLRAEGPVPVEQGWACACSVPGAAHLPGYCH